MCGYRFAHALAIGLQGLHSSGCVNAGPVHTHAIYSCRWQAGSGCCTLAGPCPFLVLIGSHCFSPLTPTQHHSARHAQSGSCVPWG